MRALFSVLFLCISLLFGVPISANAEASSSPADRHFDAGAAEAYYAQMKAEMAQLVRLKVTGSNVRIREGAGTSFAIDSVAQRGDIFYAKKQSVQGTDGLMWHETVGALYSQTETYVEKLEGRYICADFVTASPLTKETKTYVGDEGFIRRQLYKIFPAGSITFTLDRDTPFRPIPECPLADEQKNVLPAGQKLCYDSYAVSNDGYLEFSAELALPEGNRMRIGWIRLEDYACLNFGKSEADMRAILNYVVSSYRQFHKDKVKNI